MEKQLRTQATNLVANTQATLTWGGNDFITAFKESVIKKKVAIRFSCSTTCANPVNCGVRYQTLTKTYQIAERQTLFLIPAGKSVEITPATQPALAQLNEWIQSISLDLIAPVAGSVTAQLIVDDESPPLTADPGELKGLDVRLNQDYLPIVATGAQVVVPGGNPNTVLYTVPAGKRFIVDFLYVLIDPTPTSMGGALTIIALSINGLGQSVSADFYSLMDQHLMMFVTQAQGIILEAGGSVSFSSLNFSASNKDISVRLYGREIF